MSPKSKARKDTQILALDSRASPSPVYVAKTTTCLVPTAPNLAVAAPPTTPPLNVTEYSHALPMQVDHLPLPQTRYSARRTEASFAFVDRSTSRTTERSTDASTSTVYHGAVYYGPVTVNTCLPDMLPQPQGPGAPPSARLTELPANVMPPEPAGASRASPGAVHVNVTQTGYAPPPSAAIQHSQEPVLSVDHRPIIPHVAAPSPAPRAPLCASTGNGRPPPFGNPAECWDDVAGRAERLLRRIQGSFPPHSLPGTFPAAPSVSSPRVTLEPPPNPLSWKQPPPARMENRPCRGPFSPAPEENQLVSTELTDPMVVGSILGPGSLFPQVHSLEMQMETSSTSSPTCQQDLPAASVARQRDQQPQHQPQEQPQQGLGPHAPT